MSFEILCEDATNLIIGVGPFDDENFGEGYSTHIVLDDDKYTDAVKDGAMWDPANRTVKLAISSN